VKASLITADSKAYFSAREYVSARSRQKKCGAPTKVRRADNKLILKAD
jgi:hypothetical protein